jgi:hypothetical protein
MPCLQLRTLIAVNIGILDYHCPSIRGRELLCLASRLSEATVVLDLVVRARSTRHAQHMACEKVLRAAEVNVRGV